MKKFKIFLLLILVINFIPVQSLNMKVVPQESTVSIKGTSTLHDWEMRLSDIESSTNINSLPDGTIEISETKVSFKAESLKSGNSGLDDKAYEALKTGKHPTISFTQSEKISIKPGNSKFKAKVKGVLKVAGTSKPIELEINGEQLNDGSYRVLSDKPLKMTDFDVTPPRAMLGTIRSGNDVVIKIDVTFR